MMRFRAALWSVAAACLWLTIVPSRAAETLPAELSDAVYWKMISDFSEPDGPFMYQVVTSNETAYQRRILIDYFSGHSTFAVNAVREISYGVPFDITPRL